MPLDLMLLENPSFRRYGKRPLHSAELSARYPQSSRTVRRSIPTFLESPICYPSWETTLRFLATLQQKIIVEIMENEFYDLGGIRPEMAQKTLAKNGVEISHEEAKNVLELLTFLVNLSMDQVLDQE